MTFSCEKVGVEFFDTAPTRYRASVEIEANAEQVFEVLLDADSWARWALPIKAVEWTSPFPIEVGSTRTVKMVRGLVAYEEFIAYEHLERMAFRFDEVSKDGIQAFAEDYRVAELGAQRTRVEWTMAMKTARDRSGFLSKLSGSIMQIMVNRMLRKFGRLVESHASTNNTGSTR